MTLLIGLAIRSSIILAVGLLLSASLSKRSAALRHRVLAGALLAAVLVMPVSLTLPGWSVALPFHGGDADSTSIPALLTDASAPVTGASPAARTSDSAPRATDNGLRTTAPESVLVAAWLAGVFVAAGLLIAGLIRVGRLAARASRVEDARWLQMLEDVATRYGLTREIVISRTDSADLLATWGLVRPHVLLPHHAKDWTRDRLHVVLCHELAHIRRHDWLVQIGAEALRAILWFNPLVWMVCTRLRRESEQACDDEVLGLGVGGRDYAAHLLALARQCRRPGSTWASAMPMAHPSTLERRIVAMLNPKLDRQAPSRRAVAALAVLLLMVALPVGALRARQAGPAPLVGTIYDVSGGVLPGVQVALVGANEATTTTSTDASGRFEFPSVAPGTYILEAKLAGFRTLRHDLALRDTPDWHPAITLQVGELQETITVQASRAGAPNQGAASGQPVRVGGNIKPPLKVKDVKPIYPASMQDAGLAGVVPLQALIGRDGTVSSVRVLSAQVHPDFAVAAIDAVRQWRFTPTLLNGEAVEVMMTVSVRFNLQQ